MYPLKAISPIFLTLSPRLLKASFEAQPMQKHANMINSIICLRLRCLQHSSLLYNFIVQGSYSIKYNSRQWLMGAAKSFLKYQLALSICGFLFQMFTKHVQSDSFEGFTINQRLTKNICRLYNTIINNSNPSSFLVLFPTVIFAIIWNAK